MQEHNAKQNPLPSGMGRVKLEHRINLIIHSVQRLPRWIGLIRDGEPEVKKAAYNGLQKESWILTKHAIRLWWYVKWHKVKRKGEENNDKV